MKSGLFAFAFAFTLILLLNASWGIYMFAIGNLAMGISNGLVVVLMVLSFYKGFKNGK